MTEQTRAGHSLPAFQSPFQRTKALPQLVPVREAAVSIGVSPRTLRRRVEDGSLPAVRIKGRLYVKPEELRAFVERHLELAVD